MKNKWLVGMLMIALLPVAVAAQNSYMAKPGNGSLFGGKQQEKATVSQAPKQENISYASDYSTRTDNWGIGAHIGVAENTPKDMEDLDDEASDHGVPHDLAKRPMVFGLEVFYETMLDDNPANKVGFKAGWDMYGENKSKVELDPGDTLKLTETTYAFPITVYYKHDNGLKNLSWLAGVGATIMHSELEASGDYDESWTKTKVFPHIIVGGEYRFTEVFALGLDVKYNISAKMKKDGLVLSDRSGLGAALTGRFYF